jgi:serine protease Do
VQTDAPINSGNSGGPLISLSSGKVIGISSATISKSRSEGLNFAVPMIHACKVISLMSKPRTSLMKRIGVHVSGVVIAPENFRDDEEANPQKRALIQDVARASIGRSAGIRAYDLLISIDGENMTNPRLICQYLKRAERDKRKVRIITKENEWSYRSHSKYDSYEIKTRDVRLVGPEAPESCG